MKTYIKQSSTAVNCTGLRVDHSTRAHTEISCAENNSLRSHLGLFLASISPHNIFTAMLLSHILRAGPTILPHHLDLDVVEVFCFLSQNQIFVLQSIKLHLKWKWQISSEGQLTILSFDKPHTICRCLNDLYEKMTLAVNIGNCLQLDGHSGSAVIFNPWGNQMGS